MSIWMLTVMQCDGPFNGEPCPQENKVPGSIKLVEGIRGVAIHEQKLPMDWSTHGTFHHCPNCAFTRRARTNDDD